MTRIYTALTAQGMLEGKTFTEAIGAASKDAALLGEQPTAADVLEARRLASLEPRVLAESAGKLLDAIAQEAGMSRADYLRALKERIDVALARATVIPPGEPIDAPNATATLAYAQGYPRGVTRDDVKRLLQKMIDASYLKGFRELGADVDFSHGHIIFGNTPVGEPEPIRSPKLAGFEVDHDYTTKPVAVLYHTQEFAADAERAGDLAHGYVDRQQRNWLQSWDTGELLDLQQHLLPGEKMNEAFTIFDFQLDASKLNAKTKNLTSNGRQVESLDRTFEFIFNAIPHDEYRADRDDHIAVTLPTGEPAYLKLTSNLTRRLVNPYA